MNMQNSAIHCCNPESAITVANYSFGLKLAHTSREWIHLGFAINEAVNSTVPVNEQRAVVVFCEALGAVELVRNRKEVWWSRFPSPQSVLHSCPEIALAVFVQIEDCATKPAIVSKALNVAIPNCAQSSDRHCSSAYPYRAFSILKELENITAG